MDWEWFKSGKFRRNRDQIGSALMVAAITAAITLLLFGEFAAR